MRDATPRQLSVLRAIWCHAHEYEVAPTVLELSSALGISTHATHQHLKLLQKKGLVTWQPQKSRTLQPTVAGRKLLEAAR